MPVDHQTGGQDDAVLDADRTVRERRNQQLVPSCQRIFSILPHFESVEPIKRPSQSTGSVGCDETNKITESKPSDDASRDLLISVNSSFKE